MRNSEKPKADLEKKKIAINVTPMLSHVYQHCVV